VKYNFESLVKEINNNDIKIGFSAGNLSYEIPEEFFSTELISAIKAYKSQLIEYYYPLRDKTNIMVFNSKGSETPFILVHGDDANYSFQHMLGKDQPFYGFLHFGSDGEKFPIKDLKVLAKAYLDQLLKLRPIGPYVLCGFSMGGIIAYEMAILLQKMGHTIQKLILIDCKNPAIKESFDWEQGVLKTLRNRIIKPIYYYVIKLHYVSFLCNLYFLFKKPIPLKRRRNYIFSIYFYMVNNYKGFPDKFNGELLLLKAALNDSSMEFLGWEQLANKFKMIVMEGGHDSYTQNKETNQKINIIIRKFIYGSLESLTDL
jgi:pimeloyl-ACP methyl ester carboxylesterase